MPGFDGTGPMGRGARTGWGRGRCRSVYPVRKEEKEPVEQPAPATEEVQREVFRSPDSPLYGVGRGGIPWGWGRGFCGGGFRGRGRCW
jgi:hypothetical protein